MVSRVCCGDDCADAVGPEALSVGLKTRKVYPLALASGRLQADRTGRPIPFAPACPGRYGPRRRVRAARFTLRCSPMSARIRSLDW